MRQRSSGVLLHISSLPGEYGIGDLGKGAYAFLDFLEKSGQHNWQILPIGITGYGDSPYQSFSAFAGNPYFIDLAELIDMGYLDKKTVDKADLGKSKHKVDYEKLYFNKMPLLRMAYENSKVKLSHELNKFYEAEKTWLEDFALYMAIKAHNGNRSWIEWDKGYENAKTDKVAKFKETHKDEIFFWVFTQYFFFKQWFALKAVAADKGITIIGDLPIYVAEDSSDVWANPELFKLDKTSKPISVAGCPPDAFSATGQLWGNPIYNWEHMDKQNYAWWIKRIDYSLKMFDVIRIDHFRGFEAYWEIPYGDPTAEKGEWTNGPGKKLFIAIREALGDVNIIAEDLGYLTEGVIELREFTGFPGMKILQFAFDAREESDYLPHNYSENFVAYTGTHDNETIAGWMDNVAKADRDFAMDYLKLDRSEGYHWGFIRGVWSSTAYLAIAQMQDFLGLDNKARMNFPSTLGGNWIWRITQKDLSDHLADKMKKITKLYGRL
ncbi:MAG: 4-alpha-glucanotransferase [Clostridiales bacterium 38-18]|nr:MAG: 4-alpha-glucanotransferase [Clostridiales bacterium 38-18]